MRFAGLVVAAPIAAACGRPIPSPTPNAAAPIPTTTRAPTPTATPSADPTSAPTLALHGIEVFPGGADTWAMAATETHADGISRLEVLRAITDTVEVYADWVGTGTVTVKVGASPPIDMPAAAPRSLTTFGLRCPVASPCHPAAPHPRAGSSPATRSHRTHRSYPRS